MAAVNNLQMRDRKLIYEHHQTWELAPSCVKKNKQHHLGMSILQNRRSGFTIC